MWPGLPVSTKRQIQVNKYQNFDLFLYFSKAILINLLQVGIALFTNLLYGPLLAQIAITSENEAGIGATWEFSDQLGYCCSALLICGLVSTLSIFALP